MERTRTIAAIKTGIVPVETLEEMRRWGLPVRFIEDNTPAALSSPREVVDRIREALESEDLIETRDTDLDILQHYLANQRRGLLHLQGEDSSATTPVYYCVTEFGDYVIPWRYESMKDLLLDPKSYLKDESGTRVYFRDVRELFFGGTKAFIVCERGSDGQE